jgi:xanthine dehydrogenase YagT iron-sulfur-binding subunit
LLVNGSPRQLWLEPRVTLLDALREYAGLTGTKKGGDHGQCGACTVLIEGRRINSCLTLGIMHAGKQIITVEGLAWGDALYPVVQAAFIKHGAFQCGFCAPGQRCSAVGLLSEGHTKTDDDIREQMSGNLCRCGTYLERRFPRSPGCHTRPILQVDSRDKGVIEGCHSPGRRAGGRSGLSGGLFRVGIHTCMCKPRSTAR